MPYVYFKYSAQQEQYFKGIEEGLGKRFRVGTVISRGTRKSFTEMSTSPNSRFSDVKIVAEGEQSNFRYTLPGGVNR